MTLGLILAGCVGALLLLLVKEVFWGIRRNLKENGTWLGREEKGCHGTWCPKEQDKE